jgi:hypothetical protein
MGMLSQWIISTFIVLYVISAVLVVRAIGKARGPVTSNLAAGMVSLVAVEIAALVYVLLHL